jgi:hypothetical protein
MMMLLLGAQVMLMGIGLWWMIAKRLHYDGYEIRTPANFFMGILLFFQLPMCFFIGTSAGAAEAIRAVVAGQQVIDGKKMQQKYWWIDPAVTGGAVLLAAGIGLFSARPEKSNFRPHEAPIGVRDYVYDFKQKEASANRWNRSEDEDRDSDDADERDESAR